MVSGGTPRMARRLASRIPRRATSSSGSPTAAWPRSGRRSRRRTRNFPYSMVTRKLGPALAAGCTAILRPARATPLVAIEIFKILQEVGFPAGVANLVTGTDSAGMGAELATNPVVRKLTFTGSTDVGKQLLALAAGTVKRVSLELGGHAPFLVFDDADLDKAAASAVTSG